MVRVMARFALLLLVGSHVGRQEMTEGHFVTLLQHERLAAPVDAPSARVSARGGHVVFTSYARLVPDDPNQLRDVYVFNLSTATLTLESAGRNGVVANGESGGPDISGDGRYVVFVSSAGNLTDPQIPPGVPRVYLRDREAGTTRLLATSVRGGPGNGYSSNPVISTDGTTVAFESAATDLVTEPDDAGRTVNVYWMRWPSGQRARVSLTSTGHARAGQSVSPSLSADGRYVAFMSTADLTCVGAPPCVAEAPDTNRRADVYLRDTQAGTTRRLTPSDSGGDANAASYHPAISADGRYVAFVSEASNLTRDSRSRVSQVFVHDTVRAVTEPRQPCRHRPAWKRRQHASGHFGETGGLIAF